jgi:hypothetical protein
MSFLKMCDLSTKETSDNYVQVIAQLSKRWRVIRCRHDLQWIIQRRSSADLNKGHWVGQSYHMTLESLRASCLGVTGLPLPELCNTLQLEPPFLR